MWLASGTTVIPLLFCLRPGSTEPLIRLTGLILQILGVATVIWGISETRAFFGHKPVFIAAKEWIGRFPFRTKNIVLSATGADSASTTGHARAYVTHGAGPTQPMQDRLDALEKNITTIHDRITNTLKEMDEQFRDTKQELSAEANARQAEDERTRKMLETTATGGIHISAIGATWLFVGVVLSTAAPELAACLK